MMSGLEPIKRTDCSQQELTQALITGWENIFNYTPTKEQVAIIWAQHALETGMSTSMYNYNIGTIKKSTTIDNIKTKYYSLNSDINALFPAFNNLLEGAAFYLQFLKNTKFVEVWKAIESGSPAEFVHLLKLIGYYKSSEEDYTKAELSYFNRFMKSDYYDKAIKKAQPIIMATKIMDRTLFEKIKDFFLYLLSLFM